MPASPATDLLRWLRAHQPAMVRALEALVRIESPTQDKVANVQVFALLGALLADAGYRTRRLPGRTSAGLLLALPTARPRPRGAQLLLAHADTVWPHGTMAAMPWSLREGIARGPGVYDTKAGLVLAVFALRALAELGLSPPLTPVFAVSSDEETGGADSARAIARLARCARRAYVLEPSLGPEGRLKTARKGVGHFTVEVRGRAAHAGLEPERGVSATVELAHLTLALHALNDPAAGTTVNIGEIAGGTRRNVIPAAATAEIDVRTWSGAEARRVEAAIRALPATLPGASVTIRGGFVKEPMERTEASMGLWEAARRAAGALGIPLDHGAAGGASDGNLTARHCPTLDGLGAVGAGAHAPDEQVVVASLVERAALLALLLLSPPAPRSG